MIKKIPYLTAFFLPIILLLIYFRDVTGTDFLFLHDELLILNEAEGFNIFFTQNPLSLGIANTTVMVVTFFERLYYLFIYSLGFHLPFAQRLFYFIKIFLLILLPYAGFKKLADIFTKKPYSLSIFTISLWYSFNTYTLIYLHGNAFSITPLLTYALAPLTFYYFHKSIFEAKENAYKFKTALLFFLISFALYLSAAFFILLIIYTLLYTLLFKKNIVIVGKNLVLLALIYLPLLSIMIPTAYDMFASTAQTLNVTGGETFGNLQGGFLYPFLMWFSWGIYTHWEPRNIFTFDTYFRTIPSLIAPFIIYALLIPEIIKKKKNLLFLIFLFTFLIFLFLIKGAQDPFGGIYRFLLTHVAPFRVFRSPESKLGFVLVFLLSLLLIQAASAYKKKIFISALSVVIIIQGYLIFNGTAIIGENTVSSSDRIVKIPDSYLQVANYLNNNTYPYGYVIPIPSVEFGHYNMEQGKRYIGQDILPKLTQLPFLYITEDSGISIGTYNKLSNILERKQVERLSEFPIKYVLVRNDTELSTKHKFLESEVSKKLKEVYENKMFSLYETRNMSPLIHSDNISFIRDNPIKYRIKFKNIKRDQKLYFNQSYNKNWLLYPQSAKNSFLCDRYFLHASSSVKECINKQTFFDLSEFDYIFKKSLFDNTHALSNEYANSWKISPGIIKKELNKKNYTINADGSINFELILFYKVQMLFYVGIMITVSYLTLITSYILWYDLYKSRKLKA